MPIPQAILTKLKDVVLAPAGDLNSTVPSNNTSATSIRWGFVPGLFDDLDQDVVLMDLDKRCRQAKLNSHSASFTSKGLDLEGRVLQGITRERAVKLGYKLKLWAIFELTDDAIRIVYTGHNSRER